MIIVFDFDKTLTYEDSLNLLFKSRLNFITICFYVVLKILSKLKFISVEKEKLSMINILFKSDNERFKEACIEQASKIKLTPIMDILREHVSKHNRVIVLSASSKYLLEAVFDNYKVEILGSEFLVENGKIIRFTQHPYDTNKIDTLKNHNITYIDDEYFDSSHDQCLKAIARNWHRVKDGKIVESKFN